MMIPGCMDEISDSMFSSRFQLNASVTEVMWCSFGQHASDISSKPAVICYDLIEPVQSKRKLGFWTNSDCSMTTHNNKTIITC